MRIDRRWTAGLAFAALLPLAACGTGDEALEDETEMEQAEPQAQEGMQPMSVVIEPKNESGLTGQATATHRADSVVMAVTVSDATQDGDYPAHVHSGTCAETGGVLAPLSTITVADGTGSASTTLGADQVPADEPAVIQIHLPDGTPAACGDLRGHGSEEGMESGMEGEGEMADTAGM